MDTKNIKKLATYEKRHSVWVVVDQKGIQCPSCEGKIAVNVRKWKKSMTTTTLRPCPYCWHLSRVPGTNPTATLKRAYGS